MIRPKPWKVVSDTTLFQGTLHECRIFKKNSKERFLAIVSNQSQNTRT